MSWRIEEADALTLLRELPDEWAQTCLTSPPSTQAPEVTLAVLAELRRVLREDGTLWLLRRPGGPLLDALRKQGWILQRPPAWARPLALECNTALRPSLLTRQARYFHNAHTAAPHTRLQRHSRPGTSGRARHIQRCALAHGHDPQLVKWCVLAGSSPLACGACGAPYRRARPGENSREMRHPTCPHNNPDGRCLVLDPFYEPAPRPPR